MRELYFRSQANTHYQGIAPLVVVLMQLLTFLICGCSKAEQSSPYKVVDSGAWVHFGGAQERTFWLDNDRVIFVSTSSLKPGSGPNMLTIWTPTTGKIGRSHRGEAIKCVQKGVVAFNSRDEAGKFHLYRGTLDKLQDISSSDRNLWFDEYFDCNWTERTPLVLPYFQKLKDDNWLEIISRESVEPFAYGEARYYESRGSTPVTLPVFADMEGNYKIKYNELRNAYFISPGKYYPDDAHYHSIWWLKRDGTVSEEPLPIPFSFVKSLPKTLPKGHSQGALTFFPLKNGYLIHSGLGGTKSMTDIGLEGLYLLAENKIGKVLLGAIHGISISPDGCSVAFVHAKNTQEYLSQTQPYRTVKSINFCNGGNIQ